MFTYLPYNNVDKLISPSQHLQRYKCMHILLLMFLITKVNKYGSCKMRCCSGSRHILALTPETSLTLGPNKIQLKDTVKNVGTYFDPTLSMHQHITYVCKTANSELQKIASVKSFVTQGATLELVSSLIFSCLGYCNDVLTGLPSEELLEDLFSIMTMSLLSYLSFTGYLSNSE